MCEANAGIPLLGRVGGKDAPKGGLALPGPHSKHVCLTQHSLWQRVRVEEGSDSPAWGGSAFGGRQMYQESQKGGKACEALSHKSPRTATCPPSTLCCGRGSVAWGKGLILVLGQPTDSAASSVRRGHGPASQGCCEGRCHAVWQASGKSKVRNIHESLLCGPQGQVPPLDFTRGTLKASHHPGPEAHPWPVTAVRPVVSSLRHTKSKEP